MDASSFVPGWVLAVCVVLVGLLLLALHQWRSAAANLRWGRHILVVHEEERQRIARELHRDAFQQLFLARLSLDRDDHDAVAESIEAGSASLQRLVTSLYPAALQQLPLHKALAGLVLTHDTDRAPTLSLTTEGEATLSEVRRVALYRVAQEALADVTRHARATTVWVHLGTQSGMTSLSITDDGGGGAEAVDRGRAASEELRTMSERMKIVGGGLQFESKPGQGTAVIAKVPVG